MNVFIVLAYFVLGFLTGVLATVSLVIWVAKRSISKYEKALKKGSSLADRMQRVKDISVEQLEMASKVDMPQRNALDGKYKNSLISKMKALDEEKIEILRSILKDGHDPELTTMDESGVVNKMKLSEYMAHMGISVAKPESKSEKIGRFTIHKGGKDGGDNTTH